MIKFPLKMFLISEGYYAISDVKDGRDRPDWPTVRRGFLVVYVFVGMIAL